MSELTIIGSGQYNYDVIKLRQYPRGFIVGRRNPHIDHVLTQEVGGTCGNVMCMLAYLGWRAQPQVKLIDNEEGRKLADSLSHYGCDLRYVTFTPKGGFSSLECVHRKNRNTGEHELVFRSCGPNGSRFRKITELRAADEVPSLLDSISQRPEVYFFDHNEAGPRKIAQELRQQGTLVYYECENCSDWKKFLKCVEVADIVKFSNENVTDISFCESYPDKLFIQTLGADGMRFRMPNGQWHSIAPVRVDQVVDWEGCGDTTTAVFINELGKSGLIPVAEITETQVRSALEEAARMAALCTQYYGSKGWMKN